MHRSFCNPRPYLNEVTAYTVNFLLSVLLSPFRWVAEYFKTRRANEVQPLFTRKLKFLLGTLLLQRTSYNKVSLFSNILPHNVFSSLWESSSHRKHHQPKHPDRRSHTDGFSWSKCCYQEVFWEMQWKSVFQSWETCNPSSGESGKPTEWTEKT